MSEAREPSDLEPRKVREEASSTGATVSMLGCVTCLATALPLLDTAQPGRLMRSCDSASLGDTSRQIQWLFQAQCMPEAALFRLASTLGVSLTVMSLLWFGVAALFTVRKVRTRSQRGQQESSDIFGVLHAVGLIILPLLEVYAVVTAVHVLNTH